MERLLEENTSKFIADTFRQRNYEQYLVSSLCGPIFSKLSTTVRY